MRPKVISIIEKRFDGYTQEVFFRLNSGYNPLVIGKKVNFSDGLMIYNLIYDRIRKDFIYHAR